MDEIFLKKLAEDRAKVMIAFSEGKAIQCQPVYEDWRDWHDCNDPSWDWTTYDYRIKPVPTIELLSPLYYYKVQISKEDLSEETKELLKTAIEEGKAEYFRDDIYFVKKVWAESVDLFNLK